MRPPLTLLVAAGGFIGAAARLLTWRLVELSTLPLWVGTMVVNVLGSFLMGVLLARIPPESARLRAFIGVGVLGAFTTFSAFSADAVMLLGDGTYLAAVGYIALSLGGCLVGVFAGERLARRARP